MRLTPCLLLLLACSQRKLPSNEALLTDAAPPATAPPPVIAPVAGATAEGGAAVFAAACAPCHGPAGKGDGPKAASLPRAPTDLTREGFLCRTTVGPRPMASDADLDATLDHGSHRGLPPLSPVDRSAVILHVKSLAPGYARPPLPVLAVPAETADGPADRERGRILYYAVGCWRCHGASGEGDGTFVRELAWGGRALGKLAPLSSHGQLCGDSPQRLYLTVALGLGTSPAIMPRHLEMLSLLGRPKDGEPASWTHALEGKLPAEDVTKVRDFLAGLPPRADTVRLPAAARDERGAAFTWSLVHFVRSR